MKVMVYKPREGKHDVLVIPSVGRGLSPVLLKDVARENLSEEVRAVVEEIRGQPRPGSSPRLF